MTTKITEKNISGLANAGIDWQPVVTADGSTGLTVVAGRGYFIDTTSATQTITLPASPNVGDVLAFKDYARTWNSNAITISSALFDGVTKINVFNTQGQTVRLIYTGNTKGWSLENEDTVTALNAQFTSATGGTVTTSGDYKIHTFTGDGCFVVAAAGNGPTIPTGGPNTVSYLVVAGGGGVGPSHWSGGGGAGGFREGRDIAPSYTASPLVAPTGLTITATTYPVTVGGGGAGGNGSNSVFSTITSAGGGWGGSPGAFSNTGGSGGGGAPYAPGSSETEPGKAGNTPPTSPPQGNPGGYGFKWAMGFAAASGGGGGAGGAGGNSLPYPGPQCTGNGPVGQGGDGGNGAATSITGSPVTYAGGGGGTSYLQGRGGIGGPGGGGNGGVYNPVPAYTSAPLTPSSGTANTGGGAGSCNNFEGNTGGKGIVVVRYKYQ